MLFIEKMYYFVLFCRISIKPIVSLSTLFASKRLKRRLRFYSFSRFTDGNGLALPTALLFFDVFVFALSVDTLHHPNVLIANQNHLPELRFVIIDAVSNFLSSTTEKANKIMRWLSNFLTNY